MTQTPNPTQWWFYHVKGDGVDNAVLKVTKLCLTKGWRVLIASPDEARRETLDRLLWTADPVSFIPHGRAEAEGLNAADQPVLISATTENHNGADILLLLDSAQVSLEANFTRSITVFGDMDAAQKTTARARFKAAKDTNLTVKYFQQDPNGRWVEQA